MSGAPDFTKLVTPTQVDELLALSLQSFTTGGATVGPWAAQHQYVGLKVLCITNSLGSLTPLAIQAKNVTTGEYCVAQSFCLGSASSNRSVAVLYLPIGADAGHQVEIFCASLTGSNLTNAVAVAVFGLGSMPTDAPLLRADGRLPAIGAFTRAYVNTTSGTAVPAPPAGVCVLVKAITGPSWVNSTGALEGEITGVINGNSVALLTWGYGTTPAPAPNIDFGSGLLLDPAQGLGINQSVNASFGFGGAVFYDLVL